MSGLMEGKALASKLFYELAVVCENFGVRGHWERLRQGTAWPAVERVTAEHLARALPTFVTLKDLATAHGYKLVPMAADEVAAALNAPAEPPVTVTGVDLASGPDLSVRSVDGVEAVRETPATPPPSDSGSSAS